ncbi:DNA mismatch repair protein mutS [Achlya hypogyna]|uniref:DNA mismatch repair protein mutS n=1 Tax=Achlya hypogyna TaxID=1202772 RepID=A0A1V9Y5B5_ACHHY|nr:DNA mismatch repair protein mutS [Achlya hypogyna]
MGCFVPAAEAHIPLRTRIFTRFGTSDDMEENASTFTVEMLELAFILDNLSSKSLILIDELGRGTSNEEGLAIAWSTCETLMHTKAYTCFATHFHGLRELSTMYANCRNFHLEASNTSANLLAFKYKLSNGPSDRSHGYGIQMAKVCGLPTETVRDAEQLKEAMLASQNMDPNIIVDTRNKNLNNKLLHHLMALGHANLDNDALRRRLHRLREQFIQD